MTRSSRPFWLGEDKRTWDHVRIHVQLFKDDRLDADCIAVYGGIAVHADAGSGEAHPSKETLGRYTSLSVRRVFDCLKKLTETEYIEVNHETGKASTYRLLPPPTLAGDAGVPGTTRQTTSAGGATELEPLTRTNNKGKSKSSRQTLIKEWTKAGCKSDSTFCDRKTKFCSRCSIERRRIIDGEAA